MAVARPRARLACRPLIGLGNGMGRRCAWIWMRFAERSEKRATRSVLDTNRAEVTPRCNHGGFES
jgi:hypothetical protein